MTKITTWLLMLMLLLALGGCNLKLPDTSSPPAAAAADPSCEPPATATDLSTTVLVDRTTVLPAQDRAQLVAELAADIQARGGHVAVFVTGGQGAALLRKVHEGRFPGPAALQQAQAQRWSRTPAEAHQAARCLADRQHALAVALSAALDDVDVSEAGWSPVIEAVRAVLSRQAERQGAQRLVLVSDGIEHAGLSFYASAADRLRLPPAQKLVDDLKRSDALPDASQVQVFHLGLGLSGAGAKNSNGGPRPLRPPAETLALRQLWDRLWQASGAATWTYGEPLPTRGFPAPAHPA
jgi:predicted small lipoprotein YifL